MKILVVGSAPDIQLPQVERDFDLVIGANGGARLAADGGFKVDHLATTAYLCLTGTAYNHFVQESWKGLDVDTVFVDEFSAKVTHTLPVLRRAGVTFKQAVGISRADRAALVGNWTNTPWGDSDHEVGRCSTGVWATVKAFDLGAKDVVVAGLSRVNGHVGSSVSENGIHHRADDAVFRALTSIRGVKLRATSKALAERLGLELCQ
jgi:hypothetical protein